MEAVIVNDATQVLCKRNNIQVVCCKSVLSEFNGSLIFDWKRTGRNLFNKLCTIFKEL